MNEKEVERIVDYKITDTCMNVLICAGLAVFLILIGVALAKMF